MADDPGHSDQRRQELKLKLQLKSWEKSFENVNGRKPNRDDIKIAGADVKEMYKRYWFYKANPGQKYTEKKDEPNNDVSTKQAPKQSTSGIAFFEDSILNVKAKEKRSQEEGDPIMKNLMKCFKNSKKSFSKNSARSKVKKVPVLEMVPESPERKGDHNGDVEVMDIDATSLTIPKENHDGNADDRDKFLRQIFHGDEDDEAYKKEVYMGKDVEEDKTDKMFEGCELLPIDWKPKAVAKRRVTSKKKSAENFIRLDMKHKSYASKGYKKFNVQKYKRKQHRKLRRDKCFCCGESGHWAQDCPMKLSNNKKDADEIPTLDEDQIVLDDNSDDLVVKVPTVNYTSYSHEFKSVPAEPVVVKVPEMSKSEKLFMSIIEGRDPTSVPAVPAPIINHYVGSSFGSSGESLREASNDNESRDSLRYNLFDEDDMMEEFLGKGRIDDILAAID